MSDYISGQRIVEEYEIQPFEFLSRFIRLGLSPFTPHSGMPVEVNQFLTALCNAQKLDGDTPQLDLWKNFVAANEETTWQNFQFSGNQIIDEKIANALLGYVYKWALYEKLVGLDLMARHGHRKLQPAMAAKAKPSIRPSIKHKEICREIAKKIWQVYPDMHPSQVAELQVLLDKSKKENDEYYSAETVIGWIRSSWPNPYKGRPKKIEFQQEVVDNLFPK